MWSSFLPCLFLSTYFYGHQVFGKISIHWSTLKYTLEESVESIFHTRFDSMWDIIMTSIWWSLYFFIIPHFLPIFPFSILAHEILLVSLLMHIGNIFIIHRKIWSYHIIVWNLITLTFTVYDIYNLYSLIIIMCIDFIIPWILTFIQYNSNKDLSSATSCGASIPTLFDSIYNPPPHKKTFDWLWLLSLLLWLLWLIILLLLNSLNI